MTNSSAEGGRRPRLFSFVVLLAFVAALPLGVSWSLGPLDLVHFTVIAAVAVTAVMRVGGGLVPWRWHPSATWLLLLVVLQLLSLMGARDPAAAARSVVVMVLGVLLALTIHTACINSNRWRALLLTLVTVGTVGGLYGLDTPGDLQTQFAGGGALDGRAVGLFNQPNQLGTFSAVLLMIGWGQALGARNRAEAWLGTTCALLSAANLVLSFSRGAWIGAALGAVVLLVLTIRRHPKNVLRAAAVLVAVVVPLILLVAPQTTALVVERVASISDPDANPDDNRPFIYREAYRQIVQRPLLGQGPGNFEAASAMAENVGVGVGAWHTHNLALQVGTESGLLSVAALGALAVSVGRRLWRSRAELSGRDAALALGVACAMIAVLGQGLVDFTLGNPILLYLVWTVGGSLLAVTYRRTTWSPPTKQGRLSP